MADQFNWAHEIRLQHVGEHGNRFHARARHFNNSLDSLANSLRTNACHVKGAVYDNELYWNFTYQIFHVIKPIASMQIPKTNLHHTILERKIDQGSSVGDKVRGYSGSRLQVDYSSSNLSS